MTTSQPPKQQPIPAWYGQYRDSFLSAVAHAFIVHGDLYTYAFEATTHRGYLISQLASRREVVVCYDTASGISFADPAMRDIALNMLQAQSETAITIDEFENRLATQGDTLAAKIGNRAPTQDEFAAALAGIGLDPSQSEEEADPFSVRRPSQALAVLEKLLRSDVGRGKVALIIDYAEGLCPPTPLANMSAETSSVLIMLQKWAHDDTLGKRNNPFFLLTRSISNLHSDLLTSAAGFKTIEITLPDYQARLDFVTWYLGQREEKQKPIQLVEQTPTELARLTAGLTLRHIEDILLMGARAGGVTRQLVKARKEEIIQSEFTEVAEMIDPLPGGFTDLGGMEQLIAWAQDEIITPIRDGDPTDAPKGVLLVGPPGTGKTYWVRGLAGAISFNAVALNLENILGSLVGESERKLKAFFKFCKALAPIIVFVDEIDQSDISRRGNNSGNPVAANLFSAVLRFMSDETLTGQVIMVFASNRPDLIDSALKRFGRIDAIIPVLLPNEKQRLGIVQAQARIQSIGIADDAAAFVAANSNKYSAGDLTAVVKKARKFAKARKVQAIDLSDARRAINNITPETPRVADWYTLLAIQACNDKSLLPKEEAELALDRTALSEKIKQTRPADVPSMREERTE